MKEVSGEIAIRHCVDIFNKCTMEWLEKCYSPDVEWTELPTQTIPHGRKGKLDALHRAAEIALTLFPDRQMKIRNIVSNGHKVAVELDWWGTAARSIGNLKAGDIVRLRIASFFEVEGELITRHTDYCVPAE
jgi:ketosteroid isomerase-like protein